MRQLFLTGVLLLAGLMGHAQERVSLADFGGVGDGVTSNTEAIAKAIAKLDKAGGGSLVIPEGIWLTGPVVLKNCIDLHLERGAVLLFSPDKREYLSGNSIRPCISASKRHDVSITGEGIIDGNGEWWRPVKRGKVSDVEWNDYKFMGGTVTDDGKLWYAFDLKHYENIAEDPKVQEKMRTHLVRFTDCKGVTVRGVTLMNSPKFHLVPQRCTDVLIENVTVRCPWNAQNGDGIDIMASKNVVIRGCTVDVGDDGICLKAGGGAKGLADGPCENVLIEYNTVYHAHGGFVIGSDFAGGMKDITVRHNTFCGTDTGLRFKSAPERGGRCENIRISDIMMTDIRGEAIVFETTYADRPAGHEDNVAPETENYLPDFRDIVIERLVCNGARTGVKAQGTLSLIHDIVVKDAVIFYTEKERAIDDPVMIRFENVRFLTY